MKNTSRHMPFFLLAATAILVVLFFFQTRIVDLDRHNNAAQNLLRLKQLDTQLNEEALKAVSLQLVHYDTIVQTVSHMKAISTELHDPQAGLYELVDVGVDEDLRTHRKLMLEKIDLLEYVKSRAAIVRNTLNYLPLEIKRITQDRHDPDTVLMHRLLNALLLHNITPNEANRTDLMALVTALQSAPLNIEDRTTIDKVLIHTRANLEALDDISSTMKRYLKLPTVETLNDIFNAHIKFSTERMRTANHFRLGLLVLTILLFGGLALTLFKLHGAHEKAERTLRRFRDAAESIGEGFAFFDARGRLLFWNSTFERLHKGAGKSLRRGILFDAFFKACVDTGIYETFLNGEEGEDDTINQMPGHPYVVKAADGTWMMASDSPMADGGTASVRVDITQSKHREEELRKLSRAVEQSPVSVMITDTQGLITYVNPKFVDATGYSLKEALGQKASLISSGEMSPWAYEQLWKTISSGGEWRGELHNKRKDGSLFWEYASISPIKNEHGDITYFLAVKEDISERKRTMSELIKAKEEAELASHAKTQFLANMSHELRTPLNAIIGFSEIIKGEMFGPIGNDNYLEYSTNILTSGQHLLEVINDILDVSRIEAGTITIRTENVDIAALCIESIDMVRNQVDVSELDLHLAVQENLPLFQGDSVRMKQIILNLLTNAIKFTPRGGEIHVSLHQDIDGAFVLIVRDTGHGIPKNKQQKILEPFEQVSDIYTRSHEGSGLGLYLVNSFIELHGGTLSINSEIDVGTTITVRLPTNQALSA